MQSRLLPLPPPVPPLSPPCHRPPPEWDPGPNWQPCRLSACGHPGKPSPRVRFTSVPQGLGAAGVRSQRGPASERDHIRFPSDGSSVTSCWWLAVGPGIYTGDMGGGYGASFVFPAEGHAAARGGRGQRADRGVRWDDASRGVCWPARRASVPGACASIIRDGGSLWFSSGSQRHSDPGKVRLPPAALVGPATQHLGPSPRRPASSGGERPRTEPGPARPGNLAAELCWG